MTFLAYLFIIATIVFFGTMFASMRVKNEDEKYYGTMLLSVLAMTLAGLLMAAGVLGLLPELTWK